MDLVVLLILCVKRFVMRYQELQWLILSFIFSLQHLHTSLFIVFIVCLQPIWGFTDDSSSSTEPTSLQKCNIPISYSSLISSDIATLLIPMSTYSASNLSPFINLESDLKYHTSAVFASAIEVATGFHRITSQFSHHSSTTSIDFNVPESKVADDKITDANWISELTNSYEYRLNTIETCLPFPLDPSKNTQKNDEFAPLWNVLNSTQNYDTTVLNPFMSSLSSAIWGDYTVSSLSNTNRLKHKKQQHNHHQEQNQEFRRTKRSLSNVVNCRGFQTSGEYYFY